MASTKRARPPLWRDFEKLVARIEQALAGNSIKVVSPDRIPSLITGRRREVDASLRTSVGSAELLVTTECRKRQATQDVTWIEQLGCKKLAIGAARTIAVASSAFSKDAIRAAEHYGIDLRVLSEISDADVQSWVLPRLVVHVFKQCDLVGDPKITFTEEQGDDFTSQSPMEEVAGGASILDSPIFLGPDGKALTLNDLWLRADDQLKIFDAVPKDDQAHTRRLSIEPSDDLHLRTRVGPRRVRQVEISLSLRWKHERIPMHAANVVTYQPVNPADPMRPQVRAEFESKEATPSNVRYGVQFQPGKDDVCFTVQLTPGKRQ